MKPVFMLLGQSAATTASQAIKADVTVQDVDYAKLRERFLQDGQILEYVGPLCGHGVCESMGIDAKRLPGIVIDNDAAERTGS